MLNQLNTRPFSFLANARKRIDFCCIAPSDISVRAWSYSVFLVQNQISRHTVKDGDFTMAIGKKKVNRSENRLLGFQWVSKVKIKRLSLHILVMQDLHCWYKSPRNPFLKYVTLETRLEGQQRSPASFLQK